MRPARHPAVPPDTWEAAQAALDALEREERCAVLLAVESGSRSWGFASPDSDWDVRFVYARPTPWHLSLRPGRDVVERALPGDLDVSGWDARKALNLLLKGNAVLPEWLRSPVVYRAEPEAVAALRSLAERLPGRAAARHHYRSLARRQDARAVLPDGSVRLKGYLYMLRPALALRWMRERAAGIPPMDVPTLLADVTLSAEERREVAALLARKAAASELGAGPRNPVLDALIAGEAAVEPGESAAAPPELVAEAEALFRRWTRLADERFGPA